MAWCVPEEARRLGLELSGKGGRTELSSCSLPLEMTLKFILRDTVGCGLFHTLAPSLCCCLGENNINNYHG